jgi:nicotinamidase-related amidase
MQNDFLPFDETTNPFGGKFGVAGGENASAVIVDLIGEFSAKGGTIVATRDYHPCDHASFTGNTKNSWFPGNPTRKKTICCPISNPGLPLALSSLRTRECGFQILPTNKGSPSKSKS